MSFSLENTQALRDVTMRYEILKGLYVIAQLGIVSHMRAEEQYEMEVWSILGLSTEQLNTYLEQQESDLPVVGVTGGLTDARKMFSAETEFESAVAGKFGSIEDYRLTACFTLFSGYPNEKHVLALESPADIDREDWRERGTDLRAVARSDDMSTRLVKSDWQRGNSAGSQGRTETEREVTAEDELILERAVARMAVILSHEA